MSAVAAIVVAAGAGSRFGEAKQFAYLRGKPVLEWTLEAFQTMEAVGPIVLVLPDEDDRKHYRSRYPKIAEVVRGGERRQDSVWQGFRLLDKKKIRIVLVHDGVRPLVSRELIDRVIRETEREGAVVPAVPVEDTVKEAREGLIVGTPARSGLVRVQTPQGFLYSVLERALDQARKDRFYGTDEASLVERIGVPVRTVEGDARNIKITTPLDIRVAEALLNV